MRVFGILSLLISVSLLTAWKSLEPSLEFVSQIVEQLSSPQMEGRKAGQMGNDLATQYLKNIWQDQQQSTHPSAPGYLQEFTLFKEMIKEGTNYFRIQNKGENFSFEFEPLTYSESRQLQAQEWVFVGFGITHRGEDFEYDDYKGLDVEGKVVVLFSGDPSVGAQNSPFNNPKYYEYQTLPYKLVNAIQHKVRGVLYLQNPKSLDPSQPEPSPTFRGTEGGGSRFSIVTGQITNRDFDIFLKAQGLSTSLEIQNQIVNTQKPNSFSMELSHLVLEVHLKRLTGRAANIVAYSPGHGRGEARNIVIGAHMDHLGWGGESSQDPSPNPHIHPGADDNASGTALVMSLAHNFKNRPHKDHYIFVLFNAEEMGLLGSQHFVETWKKNESQWGPITAMINFDMVGRYQGHLDVLAVDSALEWSELLKETKKSDHLQLKISGASISSSDHSSFLYQDIPALFFTTGAHEDYHKPSDTFDKINLPSMLHIQRFLEDVLEQMESYKLTFNPDGVIKKPVPGEGKRASLGCIPNFAPEDPGLKGVQCQGVVPGSPAAQAGLQAMDVIVRLGDIDIQHLYDLTLALKYYHAGDQVLLKWQRGGDQILQSTVELR